MKKTNGKNGTNDTNDSTDTSEARVVKFWIGKDPQGRAEWHGRTKNGARCVPQKDSKKPSHEDEQWVCKFVRWAGGIAFVELIELVEDEPVVPELPKQVSAKLLRRQARQEADRRGAVVH